MKAVTGRTDRVVIVGAGLGGLSAALRLAGAGREVVVLERAATPGGRAGMLDIDGYRFDTGPTVLTTPSLVADALACVDESMDDWLTLRRLDPSYRAFFPDGTHLDVIADVERMAASVRELCGPREETGYRRFADVSRRMWELERRHFVDRNLDSPLSLVTPALAQLAAMGGFRRLAPVVGSFFHDPRLRRIFSFQSLYAGLSPYDALALYASIAYLDSIAGVWFPLGGMHTVPTAMAGAAQKHEVEVRYGVEVSRVELRNGRAVAVHTRAGDRIPADVVVLNADLPIAMDLIGRRPQRKLTWAPSCFVLLAGSRARYRGVAHHNLHFGSGWRASLAELGRGELMADPSFLVTSPTVTDPGLAPDGRASYYALVSVPNLDGRPVDWDGLRTRFRDELVERLEHAGYLGFGDGIEVEHTTSPADWARQGMARGTPFSLRHSFGQTGPFRPGNLVGENIVLVGCGTQPGVGVPMVLISGRLAAERVVGGGVR
jgi:phytoene desaturase